MGYSEHHYYSITLTTTQDNNLPGKTVLSGNQICELCIFKLPQVVQVTEVSCLSST